MGRNLCGRMVRSNEICTVGSGLSLLKSDVICLMIESLIITIEGEELNDEPGDVGEESVQLRAQQSRAALISGVLSLLFALSQHFIIWLFPFPECSGIPASTPPARAKTMNRDVSHLFIYRFTILNQSNRCQE